MPKKFRPAGDYGLLKASTLKVKGGWRKWHIEELYNLYASLNIQ